MKKYTYMQRVTYQDYVYLLGLSVPMAQKSITIDRQSIGRKKLYAYDLVRLGYLPKSQVINFDLYKS